jgi:hypothetical protein
MLKICGNLTCVVLIIFCLIRTTHAIDEIDASYDPPGGLDPQKVPQFVNIGFDDNNFADGMTWLLDFIEGKKNPQGLGNPATFDGQSIKVGFYFVSSFLDGVGQELLATWKRAADAGHEVACHTHTHEDFRNAPVSEWSAQMKQCTDILADKLKVDAGQIWGFRTPYLAFNDNMFTAVSDHTNLIYDCTIMHLPDAYDHQFLWPYTLHNGIDPSTQQTGITKHPGVWEIPCYNILMAAGGYPHMCGFDDSVFRRAVNAATFLDMMKWSLDIRLEAGKNRAPMTLGAHTDVYSPTNPNDELYETLSTSNCEERRWAIEEFIKYALTKPDVRFVTANQIIQWMRNPVALDDISSVTTKKGNSAVSSIIITALTQKMISFTVSNPGYYSMVVYSVQGQQLVKAKQQYLHQGQNTITLSNFSMPQGTYVLCIKRSGVSVAKKLVLCKE